MSLSAHPDLESLAGLFYPSATELGRFEPVAPQAMPTDSRQLLAHTNHMTVAVEGFHESPVDVEVLAKQTTREHYARKILLRRQTDQAVVQFGIMRVNLRYLSPAVQDEIRAEATPLGRILIAHQLLRDVELFALWKVVPGDELCECFGLASGEATYGRTALIHVAHEPAVELLEIITP